MNLSTSLLCLLFLAGLGKNSAEFAVVPLFLQNLLPLWKREGVKGRRDCVMFCMARNSVGAVWGTE